MARMEDYVVEKFIGHGKLSLVYLVTRRNSLENDTKYVLKRCFLNGPNYIKSVLYERKVLEKVSLKSPFLPVLEAAFRMGTSAALVMTAGGEMSLQDLIFTHSRMTEETAKFYAAEILCGLEHLHNLKIVHMDIKPSNVIISRSGHVLITDFNHSLDISGGPTSHPFKCRGTLIYCSPEVASYSIIDEKADIWSWGSVLVEMVDDKIRNPTLPRELLLQKAKEGDFNLKSYDRYSTALQCLVNSCLEIDSNNRPSIENIKRFEFFQEINWEDAENCRLTPPIQVNESDIQRARSMQQIDSNDPLILANFHENSMINIHKKIQGQDGLFTFEKFNQNERLLRRAGFTEGKIEELFSNFAFFRTYDDDDAPPPKRLCRKRE